MKHNSTNFNYYRSVEPENLIALEKAHTSNIDGTPATLEFLLLFSSHIKRNNEHHTYATNQSTCL
jgi:hypothetical protein